MMSMMKTTKFDWRGIENLQKDCDYSNHIMTMIMKVIIDTMYIDDDDNDEYDDDNVIDKVLVGGSQESPRERTRFICGGT